MAFTSSKIERTREQSGWTTGCSISVRNFSSVASGHPRRSRRPSWYTQSSSQSSKLFLCRWMSCRMFLSRLSWLGSASRGKMRAKNVASSRRQLQFTRATIMASKRSRRTTSSMVFGSDNWPRIVKFPVGGWRHQGLHAPTPMVHPILDSTTSELRRAVREIGSSVLQVNSTVPQTSFSWDEMIQ